MLYTELQERKLVPERGIEPPSTDYETVVLPLYYAGAYGAGYETRTRDLNLGKVALYQLS